MERNDRKILVCNCEGTMALDGKTLAAACATAPDEIQTQLCRAQIEKFRAALSAEQPLLVACTQEAPLFDEVAAETLPEAAVSYVNIRERAGWSSAGVKATPKIAALLAEATLDLPPCPTVAMRSEGTCLVYGRDQVALDAARQLAGRLDVTLLLARSDEIVPPRVVDIPIFRGRIVSCRGHLGAFELVVDDYAPMIVSSRGSLAFEAARNGAASQCDLILDLSGGAPLLPAPEKRDGYFRPDPRNPAAVQRALFDLTDMVGEFDKPRYVDFDAAICTHARSGKTGCTRCLDVCPASAITPDGDVVAIDPYVCGGCGACHSVCPTGAAGYALPPAASLVDRLRALLTGYHQAGGERAVLLAHDARHGEELISLLARYGDGLPANVLPVALNEVTQIGFEFLASAFAYGAAQVVILTPPSKRHELQGLASLVGLGESVMAGLGYGSGRIQLLVEEDPDALARAFAELPAVEPPLPGSHLAMGDKRSLIRTALRRLHEVAPEPAEIVALPPGAPFGSVNVDVDGCTLCLACVGACPTGALQDNPDKPQLRFQEDACVQCGLCKNTCPEDVIALEPRLNFTMAAIEAQIIKEEEPFACIGCGKPFGTKSSIERVVERLANKHSMFQTAQAIETIQMCENCRVTVQFEQGRMPLAGPERPQVRTTEDYLREREAGGKKDG